MIRSCASICSAFRPVVSCRYPLDYDTAPAGEIGVFVAYDGRFDRFQFSVPSTNPNSRDVEIAKAVHLVDHRGGVAQPRRDLRSQFETQIRALGADVEQQIARCRDGMARAAADFAKGCNSAGRGSPKSRSQASEPNPMMQERFWAASRNPTGCTGAARSPHSDRTTIPL
jgi:hypothetical protein